MTKEVAGITLYGVQDLREALGVSERTIREWFNKGRLRGVKISKEWYATEENLRAFLNAEDVGKRPKDEAKRIGPPRPAKGTKRRVRSEGRHSKKGQ